MIISYQQGQGCKLIRGKLSLSKEYNFAKWV